MTVATFRAWVSDGAPAGSGLGDSNWMPFDERELILMVVPPETDPDLSGNFPFTVSVDADLIRDKPIVTVLEGAGVQSPTCWSLPRQFARGPVSWRAPVMDR